MKKARKVYGGLDDEWFIGYVIAENKGKAKYKLYQMAQDISSSAYDGIADFAAEAVIRRVPDLDGKIDSDINVSEITYGQNNFLLKERFAREREEFDEIDSDYIYSFKKFQKYVI